jgi:PAS domain S-box-containing protein
MYMTETEQRFSTEWNQEAETILEAMTDAVFVYDRQGRIVKMNTAAQTILARVAQPENAVLPLLERLAGVKITNVEGQVLMPEQWPMWQILQGEQFTPDQPFEMLVQKRDGKVQFTSMTGGPIRDASRRIIGAVVICRDITKQKRIEREREQQAQQLRLQAELIQLAHDAILIRDPLSHIIFWNRGAQELYGWTEQEVRGKVTHTLLQTYFPESHEATDTLLEQQGYWRGELTHRCRDGRQVIVESCQVLVRDDRGNTIGILEINRDVTERHHLEEIERQAQAKREAQFKEAERLKDEFIGVATHELRNPLAALKGYTQMLLLQIKRGRGPTFTESQKQTLEEIDNTTTNMVALANDLLDVTRLQTGDLALHFETADLVALIRRVMKRLQMTTKRHKLTLESPFPSLHCSLDIRRMDQVFSNVIGNAIKFSPDGGPIEIALREAHEAQEIVVSIRDHGIGIPLHEQGLIFGRFVRATNTGAYKIGGTGLGLYLCRELVERHGGHIWLESVQGQGSTFFIVLPRLCDMPVK